MLSNLRHCLPARRHQLLEELRALAAEGAVGPGRGLAEWLEALAMDPADFYGIRGVFLTALRSDLAIGPSLFHWESQSTKLKWSDFSAQPHR